MENEKEKEQDEYCKHYNDALQLKSPFFSQAPEKILIRIRTDGRDCASG